MIRIFARVCSFTVALAVSLGTFAQTFPSRPLELVVHTAPGGGTDLIARTAADILTREKLVTQAINVSNKPGGGGAIAYSYIKGKRGDPHVLMTVASMAMLSQTVRPELNLGLENYNIWMGRAEYAKHLAERRVLVNDFLQAIGIAGK